MRSRPLLLLVLGLAGLAGCGAVGAATHGGRGDAHPGGSRVAGVGRAGRRAIPPSVLARRAVAYSGYRAGESPEARTYPTEAEIETDLEILLRGDWTFVRLYDCSPFAARVMKVIRDKRFDIKLMSGVWLAGNKAKFEAQNQAEIDRCTTLYATYGDMIAAVSVGNETLDAWSSVRVPPGELAAYIDEVRARITQPVTTDDSYLPFTLGEDGATSYADVLQVAETVDFLSVHVYAFVDAPYGSWDWEQLSVPAGPPRAAAMMRAALAYTKSSVGSVRTALAARGIDLPIVIGEVGWKTVPTDRGGDATEIYRAHPVNQKAFYDAVTSWVYGPAKDASTPVAAFAFEAFDEPWKKNDDGWGLFDRDRQAKYGMWGAFPERKPPGAAAYSERDAVYSEGDAGSTFAR